MFEAHGEGLKKTRELERAKILHHLRLFAHEDSDEENPKWVLESHDSANDPNPRQDEANEDELLDLFFRHLLARSIKGRPRRPKTRHTILEETNHG